MELGKDFFTDPTTKQGMGPGTPQLQPMLAAMSVGKGPSTIIEKLRQTLKETGHIIEVKNENNLREKRQRQRFQSLTKKEFSAEKPISKSVTPPLSQPSSTEVPMVLN